MSLLTGGALQRQNRDAEHAIARANEALAQSRGAQSRYQNYTPRGGGRGSSARRQLDFPVTNVTQDQLIQMDVDDPGDDPGGLTDDGDDENEGT